ncbi:hypothetical protein OGH69_00990 [Flavobacterium sp. MFBS3-15]|uniref:hypothetical protein n=1 Tax=Flavobacterium sp. MFBS3-15 TaxID=2989816 RepID=UPI0022363FC6|nr:hypothetical protein [Flavobacterium sp. MFBS3-15]MCW4467530.1 hypothetical protein [Flavobacterium sp. MFBS3-15]
MKTFLAGISLLAVLANYCTPIRKTLPSQTGYTGAAADSGFVRKEQAVKLLLQANYDLGYELEPGQRDTLDLNLHDITDTDTLGKYYRMDNGNYLACLPDVIHPDRFSILVLLEYSPDGKVLQAEPFYGGMHFCCWDKYYDTLNKHEEGYYSINTCGTGSGHCSSYTHLFKGFGQQGGYICTYIWTGWCKPGRKAMLACHLTSKMEIKNDTVTMHYKMEHLKERRNGKYKTVFSEKFDVKYVEREQGWVALDSTKINDFPY